MPANKYTTLQNATVAERSRIESGVKRLRTLDAMGADILTCISESFANGSPDGDILSMQGTLRILANRIDIAAKRIRAEQERQRCARLVSEGRAIVKLSGLQVELIRRTRAELGEILNPDGWRFVRIQNTLTEIASCAEPGSQGIPEHRTYEDIDRAAQGIQNALTTALGGLSMSEYLAMNVPGYVERYTLTSMAEREVSNAARLAWLDRIIERGEI